MALDSINPIELENVDSFSYYEKIAKSKNGSRKRILYGETIQSNVTHSEICNKIKDKYQFYDENVENLELLVMDNYLKDDREALKHCYDSPTNGLRSLKEKIIQSQTSFYQCKCAYCGINGISAMDHYAPKEKFPEYAIHPYNLVPSCSFCNTKKSDLFLDEDNNNRIFFNPYFDEVDSNILELEIVYLESSNNFSFNIKLVEDSYASHIEFLEIIPRYEKEAIIIFDTLRTDLLLSFEAHIDMYDTLLTYEMNYKKQLKKTKEAKLKLHGINSVDYLVYNSFYNSKYCSVEFFINKFGSKIAKLKLSRKDDVSK